MRVLQIVFAWGSGGVERLICNYAENMKGVEIDVLVLQKYVENSIFNDTIRMNGGEIYHLENVDGWLIKRLYSRYKKISEFCSAQEYDIIHVNGGTGIDCLYAYGAKSGSPKSKIIMQAHADNVEPPHEIFKHIVHRVGKVFFSNKPDAYLACSKNSLNWMFRKAHLQKKPSSVLFNGIELNNFIYSEDERNSFRLELGVSGKYVVGTVGRFAPQKNPIFIVDIIKELSKLDTDTVFLWVGDGPMFDEIKTIARENHLNNIIFAGATKNTRKYYLAMDCFILPSVYEGLGIVNIEAQATGLPCVVSDKVPEEANVTDLIHFVSLQESARNWAKIIMEKKKISRCDKSEAIKRKGYDRYDCAQNLQAFYNALLEGGNYDKV